MKMRAIAGLLLLSAAVWGEQELDLSFLKGLEDKAKESVDINLGPEQLQLLMGFSGDATEGLKELGKSIERIQVRTFEFDQAGMYDAAQMDKLRESLKTGDFVSLISVKEKKGFTEIAMRKGGKGSRGFIILVAEPREVTVVNIVGDLDMNALAKLSGKLGIPNVQIGPSRENKNKKD